MPAQTPVASAFATALRRQRERAGLTQAELAERAGIGVRTVSNLERGINTSPYPSTVRLLADALGLLPHDRTDLLNAAGRRTGAVSGGMPSGGYLGAVPPAPIVARDPELAEIAAALDAAGNGDGAVVLLAGEPGIGKTRLAQEAMVRAAEGGFLVACGRCFEQQVDTPYVPLLELFATLHQEAPAAIREDLIGRWPALATLLPDRYPADPAASTDPDAVQVLHRSAAALVAALAEHRPVALLLDDLHWADDATADLLIHLARHTTRDRVLLLGTYRDAEVGSAHPVRTLAHALRRERLTRAVTVGRFDRRTTARLVSQRLDGTDLAAELGDLVHRHSEGNPFFTVEIVTALVERGDLTRVDGRWVCRELTQVDAPLSVSEAIGQRVARLSAPARQVLEAASVLGTDFDPDDVPSADGADVLERALDEAVASGLLTVVGDGYAFDHSLTQQALHLGMSPVRRRRLHREVGELLERRPAAHRRRRAAEISRHLEAGGLPERALPFVLVAGDVAAAAFARAEAVRLYRHARELAEEVGDAAAAATALDCGVQVEVTAGRYDDALATLVGAADRYRRSGDLPARLRVEGMIADVQHRRGEAEAAAARLDAVLAELEITGPDGWAAGGAQLAIGLARVRIFLGQHERCVEATELARRLARQDRSAAAEAEACAVGGTALFFLDRPDEALKVLEEGVVLASGVDAPALESGALLGLQWATTMRGELDRSIALGERGLELTRRAGNTDLESQHVGGIGHTLYYTGDLEAAERHLERSVELARAGSPTLFSGIPPIYLGLVRAARGDVDGARACYDEAASAADIQTFAFAGYLAARRSELDVRDGDAAGALARLEPWLGQEAPTKVHDTMLFVAGAGACLAVGDLDRADNLLVRARRRAAAVGNVVDDLEAHRLAGRALRLRGRDEARACLEEALGRALAVPLPDAATRIRAELAQV